MKMIFRLYRYDYDGGPSLGGGDYGPGTEFYLSDADGNLLFLKRKGVDEEWWDYQHGYNVKDRPHYDFVKEVDETFIDRVKWKDERGKLIKEKFIGSKFYKDPYLDAQRGAVNSLLRIDIEE
jgi:hypothetical protein